MLNAPSRRRAQFKQALLVLAAIGLGVSTTSIWAANASAGAKIFNQQCAACHTIGGGKKIGPDLAGVTERRDTQWLKNWIADPPGMIASGDPIATSLASKYPMTMPDLGLSEKQIANVIAYLAQGGQASAGAAETGSTAAASKAAETGSTATASKPSNKELIKQGARLFAGIEDFENGGPACAACHSIAMYKLEGISISGFGGGTVGPDLTNTYDKLGAAMITWPQAMLPMKPIFTAHPLTDSEKQSLMAFFKATAAGENQDTSTPVGLFIGLSVLGVIVLGALISLVWHRRIIAVREPMVSGTGRWRR